MRVHELAKQIDKPSKEIIAEFEKIGIPLKSHMSIIPDGALTQLNAASATVAQPAVPQKSVKKDESKSKANSKKVEAIRPRIASEPKAQPAKEPVQDSASAAQPRPAGNRTRPRP